MTSISSVRQAWRCLALCAFLTLFAGSSLALPAGVTQGATVDGITEYTLANGLRVLLFPDPSRPKTTVNITYLVGSRMENYGETGMAHLLEHMVFKGTPTSGNIMAALAQRGMSFNGTTSYDRTNYFETFTSSDANLDWALAMEADRMVNSKVARADLDTEMTVVRNEMEMGETDPLRVLLKRTLAAGFDWHNYGKNTIGARTDVERVDIGRLQAFYRNYYQPDNAVMVIAGAFDPDKALALVTKYFGVDPEADARPAQALHRRAGTGRRPAGHRPPRRQHAMDLRAVSHRARRAPRRGGARSRDRHHDAHARRTAVRVAGRKQESLGRRRLFLHRLRPGLCRCSSRRCRKRIRSIAARVAMLQTIEGVRQQPITAVELDRIRAKALKDIDETLNDPQRLGIALSSAIADGDWRLFFLRRDQWRKVTPGDVDRVAVAYFKPANRTVGEFIPDAAPDRSPVPPTVDISALVKDYKGDPAIAAGEAFDATPANLDARAQRFTLANGMKVVLLPKKTRGETVNISLRLHYGDVSFRRRANRDRRRSPAACSCAAPPSTVARRSKTPSTSSRRRSRSRVGRPAHPPAGRPCVPTWRRPWICSPKCCSRPHFHPRSWKRSSAPRSPGSSKVAPIPDRSSCVLSNVMRILIQRATIAMRRPSTRKSPSCRHPTSTRSSVSIASSTALRQPSSPSSAISMRPLSKRSSSGCSAAGTRPRRSRVYRSR